MKDRFCQTFTNGVPLYGNLTTNFERKLNFSAEFWQPFVDVEVIGNDSAHICGPMFGLVLEIAQRLDYNLVYWKTATADYQMSFNLLDTRVTNLLLEPLAPINAVINASNIIRLSRVVNDLAMISILSAKTQTDYLFHLLLVFDTKIWITFAILYFCSSTLTCIVDKTDRSFITYFGAVFSQPVNNLNRKQSSSLITMVWMSGSLVAMSYYSALLLPFLVFPTPYHKIDSIEDLAQTGIEFGVFDDETAFDFVKDPKGKYFEQFKDRYRIERAGNTGKKEWEERVFTGISKGVYAMVSDQPFNDYYFAIKLKSVTNLHRSQTNRVVLPYFIGLSKHNPKILNSKIDQIIESLSESGIYDNWVKNTLDVNNDAVKLGIVATDETVYQCHTIAIDKLKSVFYLKIIAIISSIIVLMIEKLLRVKFVCNKEQNSLSTNRRLIHMERQRHLTFSRLSEHWIYRVYSDDPDIGRQVKHNSGSMTKLKVRQRFLDVPEMDGSRDYRLD